MIPQVAPDLPSGIEVFDPANQTPRSRGVVRRFQDRRFHRLTERPLPFLALRGRLAVHGNPFARHEFEVSGGRIFREQECRVPRLSSGAIDGVAG